MSKLTEDKLVEGMVGAASAVIANTVWESWPGKSAFAAKAVEEKSPLAFVEHYHLGMALLAVRKALATGAGLMLVGSELTQNNPFGIGKSEWEVKGNLTLTMILSSILLIRLGSA